MTQDEIIEMAEEAGFCLDISNGIYLSAPIHLKTFAKLVAQHEREACIDIVAMFGGSIEIEAAIRARGQA
jgi:hypothetical protein